MPNPNEYLQQIVALAREMKAAQDQFLVERARDLERFRGIKHFVIFPPVAVPAASTLVIPAPNRPAQGWAHNLKMVNVKLSAADSLAVYRGESANAPLIGYGAPPGAAPAQNIVSVAWSSDQMVWPPGSSLFLATSGAGNLVSVTITVVEAPAEAIGKILS
jgi:hypothetical protein